MGYTENDTSVFGDKRVSFGTGSGVCYTNLLGIDHVSCTPLVDGASGTYDIAISTSGAFTITCHVPSADDDYNCMVVGY